MREILRSCRRASHLPRSCSFPTGNDEAPCSPLPLSVQRAHWHTLWMLCGTSTGMTVGLAAVVPKHLSPKPLGMSNEEAMVLKICAQEESRNLPPRGPAQVARVTTQDAYSLFMPFFLYTVYSWFLSHFLIKFLIFLWKWVFCLHVYVCTTCMLVPSRDQKGASEHLEIELQMIVTHLVSSGNRTVAL